MNHHVRGIEIKWGDVEMCTVVWVREKDQPVLQSYSRNSADERCT